MSLRPRISIAEDTSSLAAGAGRTRQALEVVGPERLVFGSDSSFFPRGWHYQIFEEQATALTFQGMRDVLAAPFGGEAEGRGGQ